MIPRKQVDKLLRDCPSAREIRFQSNGDLLGNPSITKYVSVAGRDQERPEVAAILKGHTPAWRAGACWNGAPMWMQSRTWYQSTKAKPMSKAQLAAGKRKLDASIAYLVRWRKRTGQAAAS